MYIRDISIGDQLEGFFLLQDAYTKTTMGGKPFLSMVLSDYTGTIDAQIWDYTGPVTPKDIGNVAKIRGTVSEFKGTLQITVDRLRLAETNDHYSFSDPNQHKLRIRNQIVEHPYGTVKCWNDGRYLLLKGKVKASAEMALAFLAYNLKRSVNLLGVQQSS